MRTTVIILLLLIGTRLAAQDKIECDRPDQTETPAIVPAGYFQMESGFYYEQESKSERRIVYPASLLKYGLGNVAEFRLEIENSSGLPASGETGTHGMHPIAFGAKVKICPQKKWIPQTPVIVMGSVPVLATKNRKELYPSPEIRFTFQHVIKRFYVAYNLGALWSSDEFRTTGLYTFTGGYTITDDLSCYVELYGFIPHQARSDNRVAAGLGFTPRNNVMLDVSAGVSIDSKVPRWWTGLGISFRLPK